MPRSMGSRTQPGDLPGTHLNLMAVWISCSRQHMGLLRWYTATNFHAVTSTGRAGTTECLGCGFDSRTA